MAAFKEHVNVATIAVGVFVITLYNGGFLTLYQALTALFIGLAGGIFPDLDSDNSKPLQGIFKILSIIFPLLILLSFFPVMSVLKTIAAWIAFSILLRLTFFKFFLHITHHRGIFHSIPMAVFVGEVTILISHYVVKTTWQLATIYGLIIVYGFLIHLLLDEIYSINAFGVKMKKSFGTALKLYDKNNLLGTVILYLLTIPIYLFFMPNVHEVVLDIYSLLLHQYIN